MKKITTALLMTALCFAYGSCCSAAEKPELSPVDFSDDSVTVSGKADKKGEAVRIIVSNPGVNLGSVTSGADLIKYQNETTVGEDLKYTFTISLLSGSVQTSGDYTVYVMSDSLDTPLSDTFYYASKADRSDKIKNEINVKGQDYIEEHLSEYIKAFGLESFAPVGSADASVVAAALKAKANFNETDYEGVQKCIQESAILNCFKNSKSECLYDAEYNPKNAELIGFEALDKNYDCTLWRVFNEVMSSNGKRLVAESLLGKDFASYDELKKEFMKSVVLYSIGNAAKQGSGHVSEVITAKNAAAVSLNATEYLNYSNKGAVDAKLVEKGSFADIAALEGAITNAIAEINKGSSGGNGSTGGTGGSGGGGGYNQVINRDPTPSADTAGGTVFNDVAERFWGREAIEYLHEREVVGGFDDGSFRPNDSITREQAVKMLCLALGCDISEYGGEFADVAAGEWFAPYIAGGLKNGFIAGRDDSRFGVGENVTREDFAVMLYRIIGRDAEGSEIGFADAEQLAPYARAAVSYMSTHGLINGYDDGTFKPQGSITRAEAAMIIYRYLKG